MRLARHRRAASSDELVGELGQRAHDLGAAAGEGVGVSCTHQADEAGACGAGDVGVAPGVADEDDLVTGEAGGPDARHELYELAVPGPPSVD